MGYLDPGWDDDDETEVSAERSADGATHAWAEVLVPGAGWRGFDATHRLVVNDTFVTVAVGRDSRDAAPLRGSFKGDETGEEPRVRLRIARQQQQQQ
jgi:transglutaminase-like putative cysteine protease